MPTTEQKQAAKNIAETLDSVHVGLAAAAQAAKVAKLPRAARLDKITAEVALLRDYYDKQSNGKKV